MNASFSLWKLWAGFPLSIGMLWKKYLACIYKGNTTDQKGMASRLLSNRKRCLCCSDCVRDSPWSMNCRTIDKNAFESPWTGEKVDKLTERVNELSAGRLSHPLGSVESSLKWFFVWSTKRKRRKNVLCEVWSGQKNHLKFQKQKTKNSGVEIPEKKWDSQGCSVLQLNTMHLLFHVYEIIFWLRSETIFNHKERTNRKNLTESLESLNFNGFLETSFLGC